MENDQPIQEVPVTPTVPTPTATIPVVNTTPQLPAMQKPFRSKIFLYPKNVIKEINSLIDQGYKAFYLRTWMRKRQPDYPTSFQTFDRYIEWYLNQKGYDRLGNPLPPKEVPPSTAPTGTEGNNLSCQQGSPNPMEPNFNSLETGTKSEILQGMLAKCVARLETLTITSTPSTFVAGADDKIQKYVKEIRGLIESMIKMEGKLAKSENVITQEDLDRELQGILKCVKDTVGRVCPDKQEEFSRVLNEELGKV